MKYLSKDEVFKLMLYSNRCYMDGILIKSKFENVNESITASLLKKYSDKIIYYEFNPDIFELDLFT